MEGDDDRCYRLHYGGGRRGPPQEVYRYLNLVSVYVQTVDVFVLD